MYTYTYMYVKEWSGMIPQIVEIITFEVAHAAGNLYIHSLFGYNKSTGNSITMISKKH